MDRSRFILLNAPVNDSSRTVVHILNNLNMTVLGRHICSHIYKNRVKPSIAWAKIKVN